jgi:hypothetical protein
LEIHTKCWWEILKEGNLLEELHKDGRVKTGPLAGFCEHGDERAGSIKEPEIFD